jgi:hypothetical protein
LTNSKMHARCDLLHVSSAHSRVSSPSHSFAINHLNKTISFSRYNFSFLRN